MELNYEPFTGREGSFDLADTPLDVWWNSGAPRQQDIPKPPNVWLLPFVLLAIGSAAGLWRLRAGRQEPEAATSA